MKAHDVFRLGRDAEIRTMPNGDLVARLWMATNVRKGKEEIAVWVSASWFGKRAESLAPYLTKGRQIMADLEGLHIDTYEGPSGKPQLTARVVDIKLVGGKKEESEPRKSTEPRQASKPTERPSKASVDDDDIPF